MLQSVCDLTVTQLNVQENLIWELMLNKSKLGHSAIKATKRNCSEKDEGALDYRN